MAPVDAPVVDPFRAPADRFSAGNRGLEYGLSGETPIRAVDDGRVTFAGRVGRDLFVTVDHGGGLKSTLAYLQSINVARGQFVEIGEVVATAGPGFHLTARLDGVYIDPALLIAGVDIGVALIAGVPPPAGAVVADRAVGVGSIGRGRFDPVLAVLDSAEDLTPSTQLRAATEAALAWHHRECSEVSGGVASTPDGRTIDLTPDLLGERILIQVGGLGSHSEGASIGRLDPGTLGFEKTDVKAFSYAGGCIPTPFGFDGPGMVIEDHEPTPYSPEDTYQDINLSAERLADLVEGAAAARPGSTIDVVAHSLGGVVTRRAVEILADRDRLDLLGVVMTIGSPHKGADLATIASAADGGLDAVDRLNPEIGHFRDAASVIQLSEVGAASIGPATPPPVGPTVVAVAGTTDPIVAASNAIWPGATNVLVDLANPATAHSELPGAVAVGEAFVLAQAGAAPACLSLAQTLTGLATATAVTAAENAAAIAVGIANWLS